MGIQVGLVQPGVWGSGKLSAKPMPRNCPIFRNSPFEITIFDREARWSAATKNSIGEMKCAKVEEGRNVVVKDRDDQFEAC